MTSPSAFENEHVRLGSSHYILRMTDSDRGFSFMSEGKKIKIKFHARLMSEERKIKKENGSHYQSEVFVCLSVIRRQFRGCCRSACNTVSNLFTVVKKEIYPLLEKSLHEI